MKTLQQIDWLKWTLIVLRSRISSSGFNQYDMKEFKGTPAPWKHDTNFEYYEKDSYSKIDAGLGYFDNIDQEPTGFSITGVMSDADAKLIASAPELLEVLQELVGHFTAFTPSEIESFDKAKQAINKAIS